MKIYVPYTRLQPATEVVLTGYDVEFVLMDDDDAYPRYFQQRWMEGKSFINCEHDTVFWHGAIESLERCPEEWCAFGVKGTPHTIALTLNLVKFTDRFITKYPDVWSSLLTATVDGPKWEYCDGWLDQHVPIGCHQHFPPVVNESGH